MALWQVRIVGDSVTLRYFESVLPGGPPPKECGSGPVELLAEVAGFASDQASPWDRVTTPSGSFVRLVSPGARV